MPGKDRIAQLNAEIANLKKNLEQVYQKKRRLNDPEVQAISMLLDEKIVEYIKIKEKQRDSSSSSGKVQDKNPE